MTVAFDTLAYAKKLREAGFTEQQAEVQVEALVEIVDERLATRQDIHDVHKELKGMEVKLRHDMKEMEASLQRDMKEMELSLKHDIKELEVRLTVRMGGMLTLVVTIMLGFMKYMLSH